MKHRVIVLLLPTLLSLLPFSPASIAWSDSQQSAVVVDHSALQQGQSIPSQWLDRARNLNIFFGHQSVGNNIMQGVSELSQTQPEYYRIQMMHNGDSSWFNAHHGIVDCPIGQNGNPDSKINDFANHLSNSSGTTIDVAMMKICFVDIGPNTNTGSVWNHYCQTMEQLESSHKGTRLVWCTCPLVCNQNNTQREQFNSNVRSYCRQNGKTLFDLADIESHDFQGHESDNQFGPCLFSGYSQDGGHPNSPDGRKRLAYAWWYLMARLSGWQ